MLQLEGLACLAAAFTLLALFFQAGQAWRSAAGQGLEIFEARLWSEGQAALVDSLYANAASQSLDRPAPCRRENYWIACRAGSAEARARLENRAGILTLDQRVRGNGHYR